MEITGIIAEYNPFHNGHLYQINKIKEQGDSLIIAVMSGSFTQRGEVALCSKFERAKTALENGQAAAWANDNTEVIAYALQNKGYTVGIPELGSKDTIAPAVSKGNKTLLDWINSEIEALGKENFFHADYEATLTGTYGKDYEEKLVVEGGKVN
jgi:cytidyltransferase-like protein